MASVASQAEIVQVDRDIAGIEAHLALYGERIYEGSSSAEEVVYLGKTAVREGAGLIAEVGFNGGVSSMALLKSSSDARVVSFDIGTHTYIDAAKEYIDQQFPGRHELVIGDSLETVPRYHRDIPDTRFDLAFIDGGHTYEVAKGDIVNMRRLCRPGTGLIMDDLVSWQRYGKGPSRAWAEAIEEGLIVQEELVKDGRVVQELRRPALRAWALGRYVLPRL
jgi:predicted O-methyltransferase YrrM